MQFNWYDCWPLLAMAALLYGAILAKGGREWCARREARRRARALCAQDKHDLTGCIQRASLAGASHKLQVPSSRTCNLTPEP